MPHGQVELAVSSQASSNMNIQCIDCKRAYRACFQEGLLQAPCFVREVTGIASSASALTDLVMSRVVSNVVEQATVVYDTSSTQLKQLKYRLVVLREVLTSNHGHKHVREPRLDPHPF